MNILKIRLLLSIVIFVFFGIQIRTTFAATSLIGETSGIVSGSAPGSTTETWLGEFAGTLGSSKEGTTFIGDGAGAYSPGSDSSTFIGDSAGSVAPNSTYSFFAGYETGNDAHSTLRSNFIGGGAGGGSLDTSYSNFIGDTAGAATADISDSNFIGHQAGYWAVHASQSSFTGSFTGYQARNAHNSNFLGYYAGAGATNAANSIFIGDEAGLHDTVNNTSGGYSILIGPDTSTGGYSDSIALGSFVKNTAPHQFFVDSDIKNFDLAGVDYKFPTIQATAAGYVLTNDGAGNLTWAPASSGNSGTITSITASLPLTGGVITSTGTIGCQTASGSQAGCLDSTDWNTFNSKQSALSFADSLINTTGTVTLSGDSVTPGNSMYYGTNALGVKGFFALPTGNVNGSTSLIGSTSGITSNPTPGSTAETWLGYQAGGDGADINNTVFLGIQAGYYATNASDSNFFGFDAGENAMDAANSNFLGNEAGEDALDATYSNFVGYEAGYGATSSTNSNFLGNEAGYGASGAYGSNFLGQNAGNSATEADYSNFIGDGSGNGANGATNSNFLGTQAGSGAIAAAYSNFLGEGTGGDATNASYANFLGWSTGSGATNASYSNFLGSGAGAGATNAANSIFIGYEAGENDYVNDTSSGDWSILIGNSTSTGGYSNSIALGANANNTKSNQFMIGSSISPINSTTINGNNGQSCTITTGTGISCSSDEALKTNITDLPTDTLDTLDNVRTVTYNWIADPTSPQMIGFLAEDIQQYYPQVVETAPNGYLQVNYAEITPVLVEAIRELDLKVDAIDPSLISNDSSFFSILQNWLASATNGITKITTQQICLTDATGQTCLSREQIDQLLQTVSTQSGDTSTETSIGATSTSSTSTPSMIIGTIGTLNSTSANSGISSSLILK